MPLAMYNGSAKVPHPPVDIVVFTILEDAIRAAWEILHQSPPPGLDLANATEDKLNFYLCETLQDRVLNRGIVDGFDENYFQRVQSAPEVRNYNHRHIKKRPDFVVHLTGRAIDVRPSQDGVFVECKPVDAKHALTSQYCDRGIIRFSLGFYAWAMQEGLMVGYTDKALSPVSLLTDAIKMRPKSTLCVSSPALCPFSAASSSNPTVVSVHRRNFKYLETGHLAPNITLRHLWLQR
jgi:hypothetical protein